MADERWERVKRLVAAAQALEPEEQAAFLNGLGDPDLRKEVESVLAAEGESLQDKTLPAVHSAAPETAEKSTGIRPPSVQTKTPDRIGPYRVLREWRRRHGHRLRSRAGETRSVEYRALLEEAEQQETQPQ